MLKLMIACVLCISLAGCGGSGKGSSDDPQTIGEAMKLSSDITSYEFNSEYFVYVFNYKGAPTRIYGKISSDVFDQLNKTMENGGDIAAVADCLSDVKIEKMEDLNSIAPSQADLDAYKGKTGQDLVNDGFTVDGYASGDDNEPVFFMTKDEFEYNVTFEETIEIPDDTSDFDYASEVIPLTVKKIERTGISWMATSIDHIEK